MSESAKEFVPAPKSKDCSKKDGGWGIAMNDYEYIWYGNLVYFPFQKLIKLIA